ncbi:MAG: hypothetical protein WD995_09975 [Gemmatimonadota bacterium]
MTPAQPLLGLIMRSSLMGIVRIFALTWIMGFASAVSPEHASAQAPTAADSAAVLLEAARDFDAQGRADVAVALYEWIAERYGTTPSGRVALDRLAARRDIGIDRSGRVELQVWSTLYGLWLGIAVPAAFGADDTEAYGAGILLGAPAGLLAARAVTRSRTITEGQTRAITWGGTWGTWQGLGWAHVLDLGTDVICPQQDFCYETEISSETQFASMVAGGLAGVVTGVILSRRDIPTGLAAGAHYGSLWGSWFGVAGAIIGDLEGDAVMTSTLLTGNAGLVAGAYLANRHELSRNRIRMISLGGLLGGLAGVGLDLLIQPDDEKVAIGIPFVLSGAGLVAATYATRDDDGRPGAGGASGNAMFRFDRQGLSLDLPVPTATLVPTEDPSGRQRWVPGLSLTLLRGTF